MADRITASAPTLTSYKGNPVLTLNPEGRVNIGFGLAKGMLIVENLAGVLAFLTSHGKSITRAGELEEMTKELLMKAGYPAPPAPK